MRTKNDALDGLGAEPNRLARRSAEATDVSLYRAAPNGQPIAADPAQWSRITGVRRHYLLDGFAAREWTRAITDVGTQDCRAPWVRDIIKQHIRRESQRRAASSQPENQR